MIQRHHVKKNFQDMPVAHVDPLEVEITPSIKIPQGNTHPVLTDTADGTNADVDVASTSIETMERNFILWKEEVSINGILWWYAKNSVSNFFS